jgi:hypothetical protein
VPISALQLGDNVAVMNTDGKVVFEPVYATGHHDASAVARFTRLHLVPIGHGDSAVVQPIVLELTAFHFQRVLRDGGQALQYVRAKDVLPGDLVRVARGAPGGAVDLNARVYQAWHTVASITVVTKQGLFNPYTLSGSILINSVDASCHSDWVLDPIFERAGATNLLPHVYQALMLPLRITYQALGGGPVAGAVIQPIMGAAERVHSQSMLHSTGTKLAVASGVMSASALAAVIVVLKRRK